jgi:hypothetical protein
MDALRGNVAPAITRLRRVLELRPDWPNGEAALASVLSSSSDGTAADRQAAVTLAERAVAQTARRNSAYLDILAGAYAAIADRDRAVATGREAVARAELDGDKAGAARLRARVAQFERQ